MLKIHGVPFSAHTRKVIITALEKGIELPPDPDLEATGKRTGSLKSGLAGLFLGIVLYFALREVTDGGSHGRSS